MDPLGVGRWAGVASVVVALGSTLLATVVSPEFAWSRNALSELGVIGTGVGTQTTVVLFNGGLVLGAALGLAFAWFLVRTAATSLGRVAGGSFALTTASMGGVGLFPAGTALHAPAALAFFLLVTVTLVLAGAAAVRDGRRRYGWFSLALGALNLAIWIAWVAAGGPDAVGVALPEVGGAVVLSAWVLVTVRHKRGWPTEESTGASGTAT